MSFIITGEGEKSSWCQKFFSWAFGGVTRKFWVENYWGREPWGKDGKFVDLIKRKIMLKSPKCTWQFYLFFKRVKFWAEKGFMVLNSCKKMSHVLLPKVFYENFQSQNSQKFPYPLRYLTLPQIEGLLSCI